MSTNLENLPLTLTVDEITQVLRIGRNSAYELVRSGKIRSVKVGRTYRIPKAAVDEYLKAAN